jgi:hypothetical protein
MLKKTRIDLVLSKDNWEREIKSAKLSPRTQNLLILAIRARHAGKKTIGYPQIDPARFEDILLYEIESIIFDGKHIALELRLDRNNRHLYLRRTRAK